MRNFTNEEESRTERILNSLDNLEVADPGPYFASKVWNRIAFRGKEYVYNSLMVKLSLAIVFVVILANIYTIVVTIKGASEEDSKVTFTEEYEFDKSTDEYPY